MSNRRNKDITLRNKWLVEHSDRMIRYECEMQARANSTAEMFPDEIADRIGRSKEYVCGIIKKAISRAKSCTKPSSSKP